MSDRPPIETRAVVAISDVDKRERLVEVIAVPYDQEALVPYREEMWRESFARGAFDGIEKRKEIWPVNREHNREATVGKVQRWWPERAEGLVAEVYISNTPRGDETLQLAGDGVLRASIGFGARMRDMVLNRTDMTRRIKKAFINHLAFVENPAYAGAEILDVRDGGHLLTADPRPPVQTRQQVEELAAFLAEVKARHNLA
jgi:HK97 family phage prohead protease